MRRVVIALLTIIFGATLFSVVHVQGRPEKVQLPVRQFACPGRVEAESENVSIGPAMSGTIDRVFISEGERVRQGRVLARFACNDVEGALNNARAAAAAMQEQKIRVFRGSREEEIRIAQSRVESTDAILSKMGLDRDRTMRLYEQGVVAKATYDEATREYEVAAADAKVAIDQLALLKAGALPEERRKAADDSDAAQNKVSEIKGNLDKCDVRAPMSGMILKSFAHAGESFSVLEPRPLFLIGDVSSVNIRAEVDEYDVAKVHEGQPVTAWQDGSPDIKYQGTVLRIAHSMGRKTILTGDPAEKSDRDVLEVIVKPEGKSANNLPIGLRMTVRFD